MTSGSCPPSTGWSTTSRAARGCGRAPCPSGRYRWIPPAVDRPVPGPAGIADQRRAPRRCHGRVTLAGTEARCPVDGARRRQGRSCRPQAVPRPSDCSACASARACWAVSSRCTAPWRRHVDRDDCPATDASDGNASDDHDPGRRRSRHRPRRPQADPGTYRRFRGGRRGEEWAGGDPPGADATGTWC